MTPVARQSGPRRPGAPVERLGTGNRCAMLRHGYVELLGILDPALFDNNIGRFVARYRGLHILAFGVEDAEAELPRLRAAGLDIPAVAPCSAQWTTVRRMARWPASPACRCRMRRKGGCN
ncbi:VOC family protein [Pseudoroseomonas wenyumeiae]